MDRVKSYFYFTGETIDGEEIFFETNRAVTLGVAQEIAIHFFEDELLSGHIDVWYSETGEFAFDVEA